MFEESLESCEEFGIGSPDPLSSKFRTFGSIAKSMPPPMRCCPEFPDVRRTRVALNGEPISVAERWIAAMNERDIDAAVDCFAIDYRDEAPARRGESVIGRDDVRRSFAALFGQLAGLRAEIVRSIADGTTLWMEWRVVGTRGDDTKMEFVGVNIFEVDADRFRRGWIYTELVRDGGGIDAQVKRMTRGGSE